MKGRFLAICIIMTTIALFAASCDDNSRSLGNFRIDIATVIPEGENAYSLLLDNGKRLWPAASEIRYSPSYNQRIFLNYTILSDRKGDYDHYVRVNDIWNILTKQVIELNSENKDSIGNDPVIARKVSVGGDYLNISFLFNYGGVKPHAINLVRNTLQDDVTPETIDLELRHNSYQSGATRLLEGFVCFDLKTLRDENADSVRLSVKVKEWDKDITYDVIYRYNQPADESAIEMANPVISSNEYY